MKTSLEHLPPVKQHELGRLVEIIHEEFEDTLTGGSAEYKKRGRILKIILFGSYSRGTFVDEPHTKKGYRSDYDILIVVNTRKLAAHEYWIKAEDRLMRTPDIKTPVSLIVHGLRDVNTALRSGRYFFTDIRKDGIVLYELSKEPLAEPQQLSPTEILEMTKEHIQQHLPEIGDLISGAEFYKMKGNLRRAAFELHQAVETSYSCVLLALTGYAPPSHNIKFLRGLSEDLDLRLVEAWPRDQNRFAVRFNVLNEAYVKARYSKHFEISEEAVDWLTERIEQLHSIVQTLCRERIEALWRQANS